MQGAGEAKERSKRKSGGCKHTRVGKNGARSCQPESEIPVTATLQMTGNDIKNGDALQVGEVGEQQVVGTNAVGPGSVKVS